MSLRPPTLQEICEHCEVPLEVLDQECSETGIVVLSNYCDDWEGTASRLGIPQRSIDDIDNDYKRARDKRSAFVREWKRMYGHKATYLSFLRALHDLQLVDNVEEAIKSLKEKNALKVTPGEVVSSAVKSSSFKVENIQAQSLEEDDRDWDVIVLEIDCRVLNIRDISDVMNEVDSLAGQWEKFAQQLGVKPGNIGIFKANRMGDVMMALNDAVSDWLKRNHDVRKFGKPSWRTLANAVRTIDGHLAHSIAMRHRKDDGTTVPFPPANQQLVREVIGKTEITPRFRKEQPHMIPQKDPDVPRKSKREGPPYQYIIIFGAVLVLGVIIANWKTGAKPEDLQSNSQPPHTAENAKTSQSPREMKNEKETYKSECLRKKPTMPCLLKFPGVEQVINIPEMIGAHYNSFGTFLLQDKTGNLMNSIETQLQRDSVEINKKVLRTWMEGKGEPIKWETLVKVLGDIDLNELAREIDEALNT